MTSADFSTLSRASLHGLDFSIRIVETSADKCIDFPPIYLPHLHHKVRSVSDFALFCKLIHLAYALYAVSVRRCRILPTASFRFHLTMDTLAVQLMVPTTKPIADFHRQVTAHAGRTLKRPPISPAASPQKLDNHSEHHQPTRQSHQPKHRQ